MARMLGRIDRQECSCCDDRPPTHTKLVKQRERRQWRREAAQVLAAKGNSPTFPTQKWSVT